jgi:hypothetical protein
MFDVVKRQVRNNRQYLYCINDKKEQKLLTDFFEKNQQQKNKNRLLKAGISLLFYQSPVIIDIYRNSDRCISDSWKGLYQSVHLDIPSPPPNAPHLLA